MTTNDRLYNDREEGRLRHEVAGISLECMHIPVKKSWPMRCETCDSYLDTGIIFLLSMFGNDFKGGLPYHLAQEKRLSSTWAGDCLY